MRARELQGLRATAYHEAGHAVAAWHVHLRFRRISIVPNGAEGTLGKVVLAGLRVTESDLYDMAPRTRDLFERRIIVSLAGEEAERLVSGRISRHSGSRDREHVAELLFQMIASDEEASSYLKWLSARTRTLIRAEQNRPLLDALANALLERRTLTGTTVRALLLKT
jgi:ATP-dependent Zn protease